MQRANHQPVSEASSTGDVADVRTEPSHAEVLVQAEERIAAWREGEDPPEALAREHRRATRAAFYLGRLEPARSHGYDGVRIAYAHLGPAEQEMAHNDLAVVFGSQALYAEALDQLWQVVHLCESEDRVAPGSVLNNLGIVYLDLGRHDEAISLFERAVKRFREEGEEALTALATANVGRAQVLHGRPSVGIPSLDAALETFERLRRLDDVAATLAKLGVAHGAAGAQRRARRSFERAMALHEQGYGTSFVRDTQQWYGEWALEQGEVALALEQLQAVTEGADPEVQGRTGGLEPLSRALERSGRTEEALATLRWHVATQDAIRRDRAEAATRVRLLELEHGVGGDQEVARTHAATLERRNLALRERAERLERLSHTDELTGLRNRRDLDARLQEEIARSHRHDRPLVLALLDLDDFKGVNDRNGHTVGDRVLIQVAALLRHSLRATDLAARWGGEEFALLLPDTTLFDAYHLLERIRAQVAEYDWNAVTSGLEVTVSAGAAVLSEKDPNEELLQLADRRLYAAKRSGRNRTVVAD